MRKLFPAAFFLLFCHFSKADCGPVFGPPLSSRPANYDISVRLDHAAKTIRAKETLTWVNHSPNTLHEIRLYMYLNAFKNTKSTFLKGSGGAVFGEDMSLRTEETWGWIRVDKIGRARGKDLTPGIRYIQPNDGNPDDQTVLSVPLDKPVLPGDTVVLQMDFSAKLPKTIVRSGYGKDGFFLFVHWFPQAGVYEKNAAGEWGWNCHQFFRQTEFFADFGTYDVEITADEKFVFGASGCKTSEQKNGDGTLTLKYRAEDVIDFAWVAYPYFEEYNDTWEHVGIRLLIPPEHAMLAQRYITAVKQSLAYLSEHVGPYPYPIITVVDPPFHALRSGLMEYPTFITVGTFYNMPAGIRTMESLAAHEFPHQYFMGMLASNEKEEAWLDEGFATYFEDCIIDHYYGSKTSLFDIFGFRMGNKELTRLEYTGLPNPGVGTVARPGWEITTSYKGLVYSKTATMLQTLKGMLGEKTMDAIIKAYFERWKFKHPKAQDFFAVANEVVAQRHGDRFGNDLNWFFEQCLYQTGTCDFAVSSISNEKTATGHGLFDDGKGGFVFQKGTTGDDYISTVEVHRMGELVFPVDIEIVFDDGSTKMERWPGLERSKIYEYTGKSKVVSVHIDPQQKIYLDLDLNNNSMTLQPENTPLLKYAFKAIFWLQNVFQSVGFLF